MNASAEQNFPRSTEASDLLAQLRTAHGESCQVLAAFVDVRGFSSFAGVAESSDTALFLRDMYTKIVNNYFANVDFFKPTGDGLMIIQELDNESDLVIESVTSWVENALRLVVDFPTLTDDDLMISIPVPERIGIGLARGSATRLVGGGDVVIDYSGRCLNLAARLMDLARPQGVVFADRHAVRLMSDELGQKMTQDSVYVRGISEEAKIPIWISADWVVVPENARTPIAYQPSFDETMTITAKVVRESKSHLIRLHRDPRPGVQVRVATEFQVFSPDGDAGDYAQTSRIDGRLVLEPEGAYVSIPLTALAKNLDTHHVPDEFEVMFTPFH